MIKKILLILFFIFVGFSAQAQEIEQNVLIYITPMEGGLNNFLAAEILKQQLPFEITLAQDKARYILIGSMTKHDGNKSSSLLDKLTKWTNLLEIDDSNQASVMLADPVEQKVLWATNVGDNRKIMKLFESAAQKKLANDIVSKMKKDLFPEPSKVKQVFDRIIKKDEPTTNE